MEQLAFCSVSQLEANASLQNTHSSISGRIGAVSLRDLTPAGALYPDVFSTVGDDMLMFKLTTLPKGGEDAVVYADQGCYEVAQRPGAPKLAVSSKMEVRMGSIRYVHTRRFVTQLANFAAQLQNTQQVLKQMRLMAAGVVAELQKVSYTSLLRLDVKIDSPVVVVPRNSLSTDVIEADLGRTTMQNVIRIHPPLDVIPDGITGSFGAIEGLFGVVDCIQIDVKDMRLSSARHRPPAASTTSALDSGALVFDHKGHLQQAAGVPRDPSQMQHLRRIKVPLHASNLEDSEDGLSSEDNCSDSGSEGAFASWRSAAHVAHEVERYELLSQCNLTVSFARNFSLERRDLPNTAIDVHVSNVDVKVRSLWKYYAKKAVRQQELGEEG
jgi:hypothetical protein